MAYTKEELDHLWKESVERYEALVREYKQIHTLPSRGTITTTKIEAELAEQKRLFGEYCKLRDKT